MPFQKGKSGNPGGRSNRRTLVTDAIVRELNTAADDGDGTKARQLAKTLVKRAMDGDTRAADIVLERVEGKAEQTINVRRTIREFTDEELAAIAAGSSPSASEPEGSEDEPGVLH